MFSDCQPISSAQCSPIYARDPSWSSLAIQSSCWTQSVYFNFASNFRSLREQTNSRTFPAKSFGCVLYSVSFVQSKENSREKPGREINLKDTSEGANAPVKVNPDPPPPPPRDMWGFSGALSPYWQLFESPICGGFARFFAFVLRNVGH